MGFAAGPPCAHPNVRARRCSRVKPRSGTRGRSPRRGPGFSVRNRILPVLSTRCCCVRRSSSGRSCHSSENSVFKAHGANKAWSAALIQHEPPPSRIRLALLKARGFFLWKSAVIKAFLLFWVGVSEETGCTVVEGASSSVADAGGWLDPL